VFSKGFLFHSTELFYTTLHRFCSWGGNNLRKVIQYKDLELPTLLDLLTVFCKNYTELLSNGRIHDIEYTRCRKKIEELQEVIKDMMQARKRDNQDKSIELRWH
jgi:hypothetical protein